MAQQQLVLPPAAYTADRLALLAHPCYTFYARCSLS